MTDINSHIQMPRCVLKHFCDEKNFLYYYDFNYNAIRKGGAKSINTEVGYYSIDTERYLNKEVETPFSRIIDFVKTIDIGGPSFRVSDDFHDDVRKYLYALLSRSEMMQKSIGKSSVYYQFYSKQDQHDIAVGYGIETMKGEGFLKSHIITMMINKTEIPFVLPMQGLYEFQYDKMRCINVPVTPQYALTLVDSRTAEDLIKDGVVKLFYVEKTEIAKELNRTAFNYEKTGNRRAVVSNNKSLIEELKAICISELDKSE